MAQSQGNPDDTTARGSAHKYRHQAHHDSEANSRLVLVTVELEAADGRLMIKVLSRRVTWLTAGQDLRFSFCFGVRLGTFTLAHFTQHT